MGMAERFTGNARTGVAHGAIWSPRLTAEEARWQETAARLARTQFAPRAAEIDREQRYPHENVALLRESGIATMFLPREHGGAGASLTAYCSVIEAIAEACASTSGIVATIQLGAAPLMLVGDESLKADLLRGMVERGEMVSFALSERGAGSDPAAMATRAEREGDGWRIRGEKCWIGGGGEAARYVVFAQTDPGSRKRGIAAFLVEADAPGVVDDLFEDKMGMRGTRTSTIRLDTHVPASHMLAGPGDGLRMAFAALDVGRVAVAAQANGMALAAFAIAVAHATTRETFGRLLIDHQALAFSLADLSCRLSAARMMTYEAAKLYDAGQDISVIAAQAKLLASETSHDVVDTALQLLGGAGYVKSNPVERMYRDQRVTEIYEGTSEIQRLLIARAIRVHALGSAS